MSLKRKAGSGSSISADLARGYLVKQGAVRKSWKQRWMVLREDGCLYYYKSDKDLGRGQVPQGVVDIKNHCLDILCGDECFCQWPVDKAKCFGVVTAERTYFLYAASSADCSVWMTHIRSQSEHLREMDKERKRSRTKEDVLPQVDAGRLSMRLPSTASIMYESVHPDQVPPVMEAEETPEEGQMIEEAAVESTAKDQKVQPVMPTAKDESGEEEEDDIYEPVEEDQVRKKVLTTKAADNTDKEDEAVEEDEDEDDIYEPVEEDQVRKSMLTSTAKAGENVDRQNEAEEEDDDGSSKPIEDVFYEDVAQDNAHDRSRLGTYVAIGQQQLSSSFVEDSSSEEDVEDSPNKGDTGPEINIMASDTSTANKQRVESALYGSAAGERHEGERYDGYGTALTLSGDGRNSPVHADHNKDLYEAMQDDEDLEQTNTAYQKVTLKGETESSFLADRNHSMEMTNEREGSHEGYESEHTNTHKRPTARTSQEHERAGEESQNVGRFRSVTEPPVPSDVKPNHSMYLPTRSIRSQQPEKDFEELQAKTKKILGKWTQDYHPDKEPEISTSQDTNTYALQEEEPAPETHANSQKDHEQEVAVDELERQLRLRMEERERQHRLEMEQQEARYREELKRQEEELKRKLEEERRHFDQQSRAVVAEGQKDAKPKEMDRQPISKEDTARLERLDSFLLRSQRQHEQRMIERKRKDEEEAARLQEEEELLKEQKALGKQPTARTRPAGSAAQAAKSALAGRRAAPPLQRSDPPQASLVDTVTTSGPSSSAASPATKSTTDVPSRPILKPRPLSQSSSTKITHTEQREITPEPVPKPRDLMKGVEGKGVVNRKSPSLNDTDLRLDIKPKPMPPTETTISTSLAKDKATSRPTPLPKPEHAGVSGWTRIKPKLAPKPQTTVGKPALAAKPFESVADVAIRLKQEEAAKRREQIEQQRRLRQQREAAEKEEEERQRERMAKERRLREEAEKRDRERQERAEQQRKLLYQQNLENQKAQQRPFSNITSGAVSTKDEQRKERMERLAAERQRQDEFIRQQREEAERRRREEEERNLQYREQLRREEARRREQLQKVDEQLKREREKQERDRAEAKRRQGYLEEQAKQLHEKRLEMEKTARTPFKQSSGLSEQLRKIERQVEQDGKAKNEIRKDTDASDSKAMPDLQENPFGAHLKREEEEAQKRHDIEVRERQERQERERERRRQNELKRKQDQEKAEKIRQQTEEVLRRQRLKAEERRKMLEAELKRQEDEEAKGKMKKLSNSATGTESKEELQKKEEQKQREQREVANQKQKEDERRQREEAERQRQEDLRKQKEKELRLKEESERQRLLELKHQKEEVEKRHQEEKKRQEERAALQKKREEEQRQKAEADRQRQERLQQQRAAEQLRLQGERHRQEEEALRRRKEEEKRTEERRQKEEAEKHRQEELQRQKEKQCLDERKRLKEDAEKKAEQAGKPDGKDDHYEALMRRQESRTRDSISQKAKEAAEKLGLDEPPDDPLEELKGEEKDKEKVMERRLSVVAQQSAKSKERAEAATKWLDKQIRMLIKEIQKHDRTNGEGKTETTFGILFQETENIFEALSGLLITARKHKVVAYEGEILFQGRDENVLITLLKTEIPDSTLETYTYRQFRLASVSRPRKGKGFKAASQQSANAKCHICGKTVYPMEFISANDLPMHKSCFRCTDCNCQLTTSKYAALNNKFYCKTHYESNYKKRGSYVFD